MHLNTSLWTPVGGTCASIDTDLATWFRQHLTPTFVDLLWGMTTPGSAVFIASILGLCVLILVWKKRWLVLATMIATVGGRSLLGETLKLIFQRPRPFVSGPFGVWGGYSFPSGHAIISVTFYGLLLHISWNLVETGLLRWAIAVLLITIILLIGYSRIYLRVHYASDVISGFIIGVLWLLISLWVLDNLEQYAKNIV
jgi:undecaprenyl-diphosphatase